MEDNVNAIGVLLEKTIEYSKSGYKTIRLKSLSKTTDAVSSFIPDTVLFVMLSCFLLFLNLGAAFWIGEIIGKIFYGLFAVAGFNFLIAIIFRLFFYKKTKRAIENYIIKKVLK